MENQYFLIDDAVAEASAVLARMRLDGLDRAPLPFAERYVQAWRRGPRPDDGLDTTFNVFKVRDSF